MHLSRYLRLASRGARIVVTDLNHAVAELGPPQSEALSWRDRLVREGRLLLGTQAWEALPVVRQGTDVDIQASLQAVREDPSDIRRRY